MHMCLQMATCLPSNGYMSAFKWLHVCTLVRCFYCCMCMSAYVQVPATIFYVALSCLILNKAYAHSNNKIFVYFKPCQMPIYGVMCMNKEQKNVT